jgi:hypothetical protein
MLVEREPWGSSMGLGWSWSGPLAQERSRSGRKSLFEIWLLPRSDRARRSSLDLGALSNTSASLGERANRNSAAAPLLRSVSGLELSRALAI